MKINSYLEACNYIENVGKFSIKNSNLHTRKCLELLGNPDRRLHTIHVAGTNGKGSVCAFLDSVLRAEGKKTALFTSPHLVRINERMQIDGKPISDEDFVRVFNTVEEAAQKMEAAGEQRPSYFELLFLMAMVYFAEQGTEIAVIIRRTADTEMIAVADTGTALQDADALFEPFVRGDKARSGDTGSGLGLSISKRIADIHGWELTVSQPYERYTKAFLLTVTK